MEISKQLTFEQAGEVQEVTNGVVDGASQGVQEAATQVPEVPVKKAKAASKEGVQTKRTKNMVLPYLVALVVGKVTIKEVAKALNMSEVEVNKQISDNFGLILKELGDVAKKLEGAVDYFVMMEKKPERRDVLMDMLKEAIEESYASLNQMAAKG